jgi:hypothetical protein
MLAYTSRVDDRGEVVVEQHHVGRFLAHFGAGDAHRHTDVGLLQGRGIVDAVAGHGHHLSIGLQGFHDAQLLLGRHARVDAAAGHCLLQGGGGHGLKLAAEDHLTVGVGEADRRTDGTGGERVIAGDHHRPDPGSATGGHGLGHLRAGRIELGHQAQQHLAIEFPFGTRVVRRTGERQHPQAGRRQIAGLLQPPLALAVRQRR